MVFRKLTILHSSPETSLKDHLTTFNNIWHTMIKRCANARESDTDDFAWHLKNMTKSNMSKKNFLLQTVKHECLATVVENILSSDSVTFAEIHKNYWILPRQKRTPPQAPDPATSNKDKKLLPLVNHRREITPRNAVSARKTVTTSRGIEQKNATRKRRQKTQPKLRQCK